MGHFNISKAKELNISWNNKPIYFLDNKFYAYESFFRDYVMVAYINKEEKEIRPAHGYFLPKGFELTTFTLKTLKTPLPLICNFYKGYYKMNNN